MISRTKNTFDMYTAIRKFDKPLRLLATTEKYDPLNKETLQSILEGLNTIPLCSNTRGFTASSNQLAAIRKNVKAINVINDALEETNTWFIEEELTDSIINRYAALTENLNTQLDYYKRGK